MIGKTSITHPFGPRLLLPLPLKVRAVKLPAFVNRDLSLLPSSGLSGVMQVIRARSIRERQNGGFSGDHLVEEADHWMRWCVDCSERGNDVDPKNNSSEIFFALGRLDLDPMITLTLKSILRRVFGMVMAISESARLLVFSV